MGGKLTFPGGGIYHATKHAVEALSDAMRFEVRGFGIDVVVIEPGLIKTGFADAAVARWRENDDGPYAEFNDAVGRATAGVYEGGAGASSAAAPMRSPARSSRRSPPGARRPATR